MEIEFARKILNSQGVTLFRADASSASGMGHIIRIQNLAQIFDDFKLLVVRTSNPFIVESATGFFDEVQVIPDTISLEEEIEYNSRLKDFSTGRAIIDFSNETVLKDILGARKLINIYKNKFKVILIDGLDSDSLIEKISDLDIDCLITPYIGAKKIKGYFCHLYGSNYFIYSNELLSKSPKKAKKNPNNILITMGGSDPLSITLNIIKSLEEIGDAYKIMVVVGILFKTDFKERIKLFSKNHQHISVIDSPKDLSSLYLEADIVITADGLSKYEIAYLGIPMMIIHNSKKTRRINDEFLKKTYSFDLGIIQDFNEKVFLEDFRSFIQDWNARRNNSEKSKMLFDGEGKKRILEWIRKI